MDAGNRYLVNYKERELPREALSFLSECKSFKSGLFQL